MLRDTDASTEHRVGGVQGRPSRCRRSPTRSAAGANCCWQWSLRWRRACPLCWWSIPQLRSARATARVRQACRGHVCHLALAQPVPDRHYRIDPAHGAGARLLRSRSRALLNGAIFGGLLRDSASRRRASLARILICWQASSCRCYMANVDMVEFFPHDLTSTAFARGAYVRNAVDVFCDGISGRASPC